MKFTLVNKLLACSSFFALAGILSAAPRIWDGGGLDGFFSNKDNWDGNSTTPVSNTDTLQIGANTIGGVPFIGFNAGEFRAASFTFLATAITPYTVTANSVSDFLTLTGSGVTLQNASPVRQEFALITTTVGSAAQTWDGGAQGLIMAQIDLGSNQVLTFDGSGTSASTRNEIGGGITGTASSGLTKAGVGTLLLNNAGIESDYTGATTVLSGRLQLARKNQIPDTSKLVLGGGTFDTGGFIDTLGTLLLTGNATIDFGLGNSSLIFADSHLELWTTGMVLNIINYTPGMDTLRFGTNASALTGAQLAQISFNGMEASITSTGFLIPVPEPGVPAIILAGAGVFAFYRRRCARGATA